MVRLGLGILPMQSAMRPHPTAEKPCTREQVKLRRPGEIINAAYEEFMLKGYAATRLEDVARRISRAAQQHQQALQLLWDEYRREHAAAARVKLEVEREAQARARAARRAAEEAAGRIRQRAEAAEARVEALRRAVERASGSMGATLARTLGQAE